MSKIIGYVLSGNSSNGASFLDGREPAGVLCSRCGSCLDFAYTPSSIDISPSKIYDVSYTDDLRKLYSERFVAFCRDVLKATETFVPIQAGRTILYYMIPSRTLEFDLVRRRTRFDDPCDACGGFGAVVGAHPAFLKTDDAVGPGFFKTDIAFGSGKAKFPLIIVGAEWKALIASRKFRGVEFAEITGSL
jgi:hypothetical protein